MAGTLPTAPIPARVTIRSFTPTLVSVAHNLRRISRHLGSHRWSLSLSWVNLERPDMAEVYAFMVSQQGRFANFTVIIPGHESPRGIYNSAVDTPTVKGNSQTGTTVVTQGWRLNGSSLLLKGDYIRFINTGKVYMVVQDFNSDGAGEGNLEIYPALQAPPVDTEALVIENVAMSVAAANDVQETPISPPLLYNFNLDLVEDPV